MPKMNIPDSRSSRTLTLRRRNTMSAKRSLIASVALVVLGATVHAGGWSILTLRDVPDYAVADTPLRLTFMLRAHGMTPLENVGPILTARFGNSTVKATAVPTKKAGEYTAVLVFPRPGTWRFELGPFPMSALPPLTVIAAGRPSPAPLAPPARGRRLFAAKGCNGCHARREVSAEEGGVGPDLTGKRFPEPYLRRLLADPKAAFLRAGAHDKDIEGWEMPDLELNEPEITALVAFMNGK